MNRRHWIRIVVPGLLTLLLLTGCALFNTAPIARIIASVTSGTSPLAIVFDAGDSMDTDGTIVGYLWNFGDGKTSTEETVAHTYVIGGTRETFTVTLTVTDNDGASTTVRQTIEVLPGTGGDPGGTGGPVGHIAVDKLIGLTPLTVTFDATESTGGASNIIEYNWNFGDNETAIGSKVSHEFEPEETTEYRVTLYVWTADGSLASAQIDIIVIVPGDQTGDDEPVAEFTASDPDRIYLSNEKPGTPSLFEVTFDPRGSYADAGHAIEYYVWDFGDGNQKVTEDDLEVVHIYELRSLNHTYVASLTVYDDQGLEHSVSANVTLSDEGAEEEEE